MAVLRIRDRRRFGLPRDESLVARIPLIGSRPNRDNDLLFALRHGDGARN